MNLRTLGFLGHSSSIPTINILFDYITLSLIFFFFFFVSYLFDFLVIKLHAKILYYIVVLVVDRIETNWLYFKNQFIVVVVVVSLWVGDTYILTLTLKHTGRLEIDRSVRAGLEMVTKYVFFCDMIWYSMLNLVVVIGFVICRDFNMVGSRI